MICYHPVKNMVRILIVIVLLLSAPVSMAVDKSIPKFTYAELIYQRNAGVDKFMVYGKTLSDMIKKSVPQVKYREDALEIMGSEGWELVSTSIREVSYGFEIFYYFKRPVE